MLNEHRDLIGPTRAFDGSILFLPIKITDTVCAYVHVFLNYYIAICVCVFYVHVLIILTARGRIREDTVVTL